MNSVIEFKKYDALAKKSLDTYASKHLGVEFNSSLRVTLMGELVGYTSAGVFVPGQHYYDIKGKPLSSSQLKALDSIDTTGFDDTNVPIIGTTPSIVLAWGLELSF